MLRNVILLVLTMCLLTACNQPTAPAKPKVGVIDTARVFRESEPAKAGVQFLEAIQADMQKQLTELQEKMQNDPENTQLQQEVQTIYTEFQQRIGAEEQNVINLLQESMQRTIDALRTSKQLELIIGSEVSLSYDKALDLTTEIITEMNKQSIEFKAIVPETPAAEMTPTPMQAPAQTEEQATEKDAAKTQDQATDKPAEQTEAKPAAAPTEESKTEAKPAQ